MSEKQAARRYHSVFIPTMIVFLGGSLGLAWLDKNTDLSGAVLVSLTVVPILALLSMFWIHWRFLNEIDEYLREIQIKSLLFGAAIVMAIATAWGYLEAYVNAPALPIFWLNPIFWMAYGAGAGYFTMRDKNASR